MDFDDELFVKEFAAKEGNTFEFSSYLETAEEEAQSCRDTFFRRSRATLTSPTTSGYSYVFYYFWLLLLVGLLCRIHYSILLLVGEGGGGQRRFEQC